ncbi:MAG: hypothetical protein M3546_04470 [Actinomycetota bacterium]|nr:hypothetical protein [Actinomycetota bacterium]
MYFSGRFVCAYRFGWGAPGDLLLADAVQASAAYPGGFPARNFPTKRHAFSQPGDVRAGEVRALALVDGGAYDNMADEWGLRVGERNARWAALTPGLNVPDELLVVNSSAPLDLRSLARLRVPVLGEALTLKRDIDILYDTTTSTRRRWLFDIFRSGGALRGAIVQISQSPFRIPTSYAGGDDEQGARARAILELLGDTGAAWDERVGRTRGVKTTLSRIGVADAADLVEHGYVLAMANLHVLLGYPRVELPPSERFTALFGSAPENP